MNNDTSPIDRCLDRTEPPLPWFYEYAADLEGEDPAALYDDPGAITRSLESVIDLFSVPAVVPGFNTTLEAEAAGCSVTTATEGLTIEKGCIETVDDALDVDPDRILEHPRIETVLNATERLEATVSGCSILGSVTGPERLIQSLLSTDDPNRELLEEVSFLASDIQLALANAALDRGVDGIVVLEPHGIKDAPRFDDSLIPLINVLEYYDATGILMTNEVSEREIALASEFGFDAITGRVGSPEDVVDTATEHDVTLGVAIPDERFRNNTVKEFCSSVPDSTLLTSEWTVPVDVSPDVIHNFMSSQPW